MSGESGLRKESQVSKKGRRAAAQLEELTMMAASERAMLQHGSCKPSVVISAASLFPPLPPNPDSPFPLGHCIPPSGKFGFHYAPRREKPQHRLSLSTEACRNLSRLHNAIDQRHMLRANTSQSRQRGYLAAPIRPIQWPVRIGHRQNGGYHDLVMPL